MGPVKGARVVRCPREGGAALVIAMLVMATLLLLATAFLTLSTTEMDIARNARDAAQAFYLAESGLGRLKRDLLAHFTTPYRALCPTLPTYADLRRPVLLSGEPLGVSGQQVDADGSKSCSPPGTSAYYAILDGSNQPVSPVGSSWRTVAYAANGPGGRYQVALRNATVNTVEARVIAATATATGATRQLQATFQVDQFTPANHAVFVDGWISGWGSGNLLIAGPVFAKGWGASFPAIRLGLRGAADQIVNWYKNMDPALQAAIALPPVKPNPVTGEAEVTLDTTVRAYQGPVEISNASASVGEAAVAGNGIKEVLNGVYTTHGFTGAPGADNVYADGGTGNRFDLPRELVSYPDLSGPYTGPPLGGGANPASHDAYLRDGALAIGGGLIIDQATNSFSYPTGLSDLSQCTGNCLIYQAAQPAADGTQTAPPALLIKGIVWVQGNVNFGGLGTNRLPAIQYKGAGTVYARAGATPDTMPLSTVQVTADLLPSSESNPNNNNLISGAFPSTHRLGLISSGSVVIGEGFISNPPTLRLAASVYANSYVWNYWPYQIAGSVMARYLYVFQGASFYYVPALDGARPPGMPGVVPPKAGSPYFVRTIAWRDIMP